MMSSCEWMNKHAEPCTLPKISPEKHYCRVHARYEGKYSPEDIPSLRKCITCSYLTKPTEITNQCSSCFEKNPIRNCKWKNRDDNPCSRKALPGKICCKEHELFENVSLDECCKCSRCRLRYIMKDYTRCPKCYPPILVCPAKMIDGTSCIHSKLNGKTYCGRHSKYENIFTPEDFNTLPFCKGCRTLFKPDETMNKVCKKCLNYSSLKNIRVPIMEDPVISVESIHDDSRETMNDDSRETMNDDSRETMDDDSRETMNDDSRETMNDDSRETMDDDSRETMDDDSRELSTSNMKERKLLHAQQVSRGDLEWICIQCGENKPKKDFETITHGYRLKCVSCSKQDNLASSKYRQEHIDKVRESSKFYENQRKEKRKKIIEEQAEQVASGCETLKCIRCFQDKPLASFVNERRLKTKQCYECRQKQYVSDYKRNPSSRVRRERSREPTMTKILTERYAVYRNFDIGRGLCDSVETFSALLPREYAYQLMKTQCVYCNSFINSQCINGLDRVDSKGGHTATNVVPCCETCNISKNNHSLKTFFQNVQKQAKETKYRLSPSGFWESPF